MIYTKRLEMIQRYEEEEGKGGKKKKKKSEVYSNKQMYKRR